mmetsp:Transcript_14657/g.30087  ORF Transcript_14657/g.30087 Transcript_14657/m.30087 type:complete len:288 (-) Transcript_14657:2673-3536(-)
MRLDRLAQLVVFKHVQVAVSSSHNGDKIRATELPSSVEESAAQECLQLPLLSDEGLFIHHVMALNLPEADVLETHLHELLPGCKRQSQHFPHPPICAALHRPCHPIVYCNAVIVIITSACQELPVRTEAELTNSPLVEALEGSHGRPSSCIPHHDARNISGLACCHVPPVRRHTQTNNFISVGPIEPLGPAPLVKYHPNTSGVVANPTLSVVPKILPAILGPVPVDKLELKAHVRCVCVAGNLKAGRNDVPYPRLESLHVILSTLLLQRYLKISSLVSGCRKSLIPI